MDFSIERLKERDIEATLDLFYSSIEEIHPGRPPEDILHFKEGYSPKRVRNRLPNDHCVYLVAKEMGKVVGYVFSWITEGVGDIQWFAVDKDYRGKGYAHRLLERTLQEFQRRECHESRVFIYPQDATAYRLLEHLGFFQKAYIEEKFFGIDLVLMVKTIARPPRPLVKRIILAGEAGQGIKLMAHALANILAKMGKEVTMNVLYDATVRGGEITAELIFSDEKIESPFFEKADLCLELAKTARRTLAAERHILEASIPEGVAEARIPFEKEAIEKFGSPIFINMIALGRLLRDIGVPIDKVDFRSSLPARFLDENVRAIKYGYTYQD
jgi:Pyruvate/2-oxoacid:ferredoxin oxidoreductase gamma subunit/ribosomal protein S18 acetylase RimI-like enzyme